VPPPPRPGALLRWLIVGAWFYRDVPPRPGDRWSAGETCVKVAGTWSYLHRAVGQYGQVLAVLLSARRDLAVARRFFTRVLHTGTTRAEVTTDRAPAYPRVLGEPIPSALHTVAQYANNPIEADHGRPRARLGPMRGLKRDRSARKSGSGGAVPGKTQRNSARAGNRWRLVAARRRKRPGRDRSPLPGGPCAAREERGPATVVAARPPWYRGYRRSPGGLARSC
jgi:transposase, IS6 family